MFGMLFEMLNDDAIGIAPFEVSVTPSATAIAQVRTNPVTRESAVPTDIEAVARAIEAGFEEIWASLQCRGTRSVPCLLYTSDAADDLLCVDLGGRRII